MKTLYYFTAAFACLSAVYCRLGAKNSEDEIQNSTATAPSVKRSVQNTAFTAPNLGASTFAHSAEYKYLLTALDHYKKQLGSLEAKIENANQTAKQSSVSADALNAEYRQQVTSMIQDQIANSLGSLGTTLNKFINDGISLGKYLINELTIEMKKQAMRQKTQEESTEATAAQLVAAQGKKKELDDLIAGLKTKIAEIEKIIEGETLTMETKTTESTSKANSLLESADRIAALTSNTDETSKLGISSLQALTDISKSVEAQKQVLKDETANLALFTNHCITIKDADASSQPFADLKTKFLAK